MTRGRSAGIAIGVFVLLCLTGCDSGIYHSPGGVRLSGEHVEFAVCDVIKGAEIRVFGDAGRGAKEVRYMQATGDVRLEPGEPLSSAAVPQGLSASVWGDPDVLPGSRVGLFVYDEDGGVEYPFYLTIPAGGLSETMWTRADGEQNAEPCG